MPRRPQRLALIPLVLVLIMGALFSTIYADFTGDNPSQEVTTPTFTPEPTLTPSITPPPFIPEGALRGTVIRASVLLVRDAPYLGAAVVGRVRLGETYQVVGRNPEATWYLIQIEGGQGWVWGYYMFVDGNEFNANVTNPFNNAGDPANTGNLVVASTSVLALRAAPNVSSEQIGRVAWGDLMPVIGRSERGSWYQVVYKGTVGWVFAPNTREVEGNLNEVPFVSADPVPIPSTPIGGVSESIDALPVIEVGPNPNITPQGPDTAPILVQPQATNAPIVVPVQPAVVQPAVVVPAGPTPGPPVFGLVTATPGPPLPPNTGGG
jgi:uncharacterized protein YgiM (DUF1202 family)